ncbi:MAG: GGDEF domain-containing protein [Psychromonas sp.]|nr:GGDEF domain-containing protein [Psychromonas sp.]
MIFKSRMLITILLLMGIGFVIVAVSSIEIAKESRLKSLTEQELPLILENAQLNIEKTLLRPQVIASVMSNDIFLHDWIENGSKNINKITDYLSQIKKEDDLYTAFVVLDSNHQYFHGKGILSIWPERWVKDNWYFRLKNSAKSSEVNLGRNLDKNKMIFFINHKIINAQNKLIGIAGVGLNINKIITKLKIYSNEYGKYAYLLNTKGELVLSQKEGDTLLHEQRNEALKRFALQSLGGNKKLFTYHTSGTEYLVAMHYLKRLNLILCIDLPVKNVTNPMVRSIIITAIVGCFLLCFILYLIFKMMNIYQSRLEDAAWYDQLTGLLNRRFFIEKYIKEDERHLRSQRDMMLFMVDIDSFKDVNDRLGHICGDAVLVRCAKIMHETMRLTDVISRWGGEEFMLLLPETSLKKSITVAQRLKDLIAKDAKLIALTKKGITISIGLYPYCAGETMDWHLEMVDKNLYKAKKAGRNCIMY